MRCAALIVFLIAAPLTHAHRYEVLTNGERQRSLLQKSRERFWSYVGEVF